MLDEKQILTIKEAEQITECNYDITNQDNLIQQLILVIEDLTEEYNKLEGKYEDLRDDLNHNYQPRKFNPYEEYGVSPHDFY